MSRARTCLRTMDLPLYKVPSGEITNLPFLRAYRRARASRLILSTGMSTLGEVEEAVQVLQAAGAAQLTLLHCVTEYPAPYDEVNLRAMQTLKTAFGLPVGIFRSHSRNRDCNCGSRLGAEVIEKHFTLDRSLPGPDHAASLEPGELRRWCRRFAMSKWRSATGIKAPAELEMPNISVARKSMVAARALTAGHALPLVTGHQETGQWPRPEAPAGIDRTHSPHRRRQRRDDSAGKTWREAAQDLRRHNKPG